MAVELPEPLQWVLMLLAGSRWPEGDEDLMRDMARHWRSSAETIDEAGRAADAAVKRALDGQQGSAAEALEKDWGKLVLPVDGEKPGFFPGMTKSCNAMADALEAMANSTETAKISIVAQLGILAYEIATAEAAAPATAGGSLAAIPVAIEVSKETVKQILKRLAKEIVMVALKEAFQEVAINLLAQTIQVAAGNRKTLDGKELGMSAAGGAAGGVGGHLVGKGLGKAGTKLIGERMQSLPAQMVHGSIVGVAGDVAGQLATTGGVDAGSLGGSALSGGANPAIMHGASAFKGKFNAGNIPHASDYTGGSDTPGSHGSDAPASGGSGSSSSGGSSGSGSSGSNGSNPSTGNNSSGSESAGGSTKPDSGGDSTSGKQDNLSDVGSDGHHIRQNYSEGANPDGDSTSGKQDNLSDVGSDGHHIRQNYSEGANPDGDSTSGKQDNLSDVGSDGHHIRQNYSEGANPDGDSTSGKQSNLSDVGSDGHHIRQNYSEGANPEDSPRTFSTSRSAGHDVTPTVDSAPYQGPTANHSDTSTPRSTIAPYEAPTARTPDAVASPIWGDNSNTRTPEPTPAPEHGRDTTSHVEASAPRTDAPAPTPHNSGPTPEAQQVPHEGTRLASGPSNFRTPTATQTSAGPDSGPMPSPATADPVTPPPAAPAAFGPVSRGPVTPGSGSTAPTASAAAPKPRAETRTETRTEPGDGGRLRTQEQRRREQERVQRQHEFNTREQTTSDAPLDPKRDVPTQGQQERLHTLGNLKPEERRKLAQDKEFVAELRKNSTPDEFAESAAHLLVEVDPRTVQGGAARHEAQQQLARLLRDPEVAERVLTNGVEVVVVPKDVRLTDVPAFGHLGGQSPQGDSGQGRGWDDIRGVSDRKKVAITEENLLGEKTTVGRTGNYTDGYSSTTHELAHAVHRNGLSPADKKLISKAFQEKLAADSDRTAQWPDGPRKDARTQDDKENYSSVDEREYFAQATNAFLSTNHGKDPLTGQDRNNGSHWSGKHEQTLHPLLEQLYGKSPLATHSGGRANPVAHTEAMSGVGDFFRMAEGRPDTPEVSQHETPSRDEDVTPPQRENESHENRPHEDTDTVEEPSPAPPVRNSRPPLSEVPADKRAQMLEWAFKEQARKDAWGNTEELDSPTVKIPLEGGGHLTVGPRDSDGRYPVTEHTPKLEPKPLTKSDGTPLLDRQKKQKFGDPEPVFENGKPVFVERTLEAKTLNELFEGKQRPETANPTDVKLQRPDNKLVSQIEHGGQNGVPVKKLDMHFDRNEHSFAHYSFTKGTKPGEEIDPHLTVDNAMATLFAKMAPPDGAPGRSHDNASQFLDARATSQNTTNPMTKLQYNQILTNEHQLAEVDNLHFNLADPKGKKVDPNPPVNLKEFTDFVDSSLEHLGASKDLREVITGSTERLAEGKSVSGPDGMNPHRPSHVKRELTSMVMDEGAKPDFARFVTLVTDRNGVREVPPLLDKLMRDHNDTIGLTRAEIDQLRNSDKLSAELVNRIDAHFPAADERLRTAQAELDDVKERGKKAQETKNKADLKQAVAELGPAKEKLARAQADANEYRSSAGNGGAGAIHEAIADHYWNTIKEWVREPLNVTPEQSSSSSPAPPGDADLPSPAPPGDADLPSPAPPGDADLPSPAPPGDADLPSPRAANEGGTSRRGEQGALQEAGLDLHRDPKEVLDRLEAKFGTPDAGAADRVREVLENGGSFDEVLGAHLGHALDSGGSGDLVYAMQNGASADTVKYLFGSGERTPDVDSQLGTHPTWVDPHQMGRWLMGSSMQGRNEPLVGLNEGFAASGHSGGSLLYLGGDADIEHALFTTGTKDLTIVSTDPSVADRTQFLESTGGVIAEKLTKFGPGHKVTAVAIGASGTHFSVTDTEGKSVMDVRYHAMTYDEFLKGEGPGVGEKFDFVMEKDSWFGDWTDQAGNSLGHADIVHRIGDSLNDGGHWIGGFEPGVSAGTDQLFRDRTGELTTHANTPWGGQEQLHVRQRQDETGPQQEQGPDESVLTTFEIADSVLRGHQVVEGMSVADFHEDIVTSVAEYALAYREPGDRHTGPVSERLADWFRDGGNERPDPAAIKTVLDEALARADAENDPSPAPPASPEEIRLDSTPRGGDAPSLPVPPRGPVQNHPRAEDQPSPPPPGGAVQFGPVRPGTTEAGPPRSASEQQGLKRKAGDDRPTDNRRTPEEAGGRWGIPDSRSDAKIPRIRAYEDTVTVREGRGLEPPTDRQKQAIEQLTGRKPYPELTENLLKAVNPHERAADGSSLHSCLEATEALRDTHYGNPRPSDVPLTGRPEADAAWTLLKRSEPPRSFGDGKQGIDAVIKQVQDGGPGTFSTVLLGKQGKEGHALALIHGQDGVLRWADPSTGSIKTVTEQPIPPRFGNSDHVWAATSDADEQPVPGGTHDSSMFSPDAPRFGVLTADQRREARIFERLQSPGQSPGAVAGGPSIPEKLVAQVKFVHGGVTHDAAIRYDAESSKYKLTGENGGVQPDGKPWNFYKKSYSPQGLSALVQSGSIHSIEIKDEHGVEREVDTKLTEATQEYTEALAQKKALPSNARPVDVERAESRLQAAKLQGKLAQDAFAAAARPDRAATVLVPKTSNVQVQQYDPGVNPATTFRMTFDAVNSYAFAHHTRNPGDVPNHHVTIDNALAPLACVLHDGETPTGKVEDFLAKRTEGEWTKPEFNDNNLQQFGFGEIDNLHFFVSNDPDTISLSEFTAFTSNSFQRLGLDQETCDYILTRPAQNLAGHCDLPAGNTPAAEQLRVKSDDQEVAAMAVQLTILARPDLPLPSALTELVRRPDYRTNTIELSADSLRDLRARNADPAKLTGGNLHDMRGEIIRVYRAEIDDLIRLP
ncbi:hypothetical protein KCMC57_up49120 [Kitasatospora sp. CMC57]|uniref:Tox-PL domain-containing protein n=1 Tax=Kitasatospora sp. CMC57 TaxID=3231513 RepID=A0AB33JZA2_9ACTN